MRTLQEISQSFPDSAVNGLSSDAVARSVKSFGANKLTPMPREPLWQKFLEKFDEPIIKILLAAALLSMFVDLFQANYFAAGAALAITAVVVALTFLMGKSQWLPTVLFVAAIMLFFVGLAFQHPSVEGLAVMVAVILATGVAFLSEYKSDREFEALNTHKEALRVKVLREGAFHTIGLEEVVVGDAVDLETGDEIPADGRVVKAVELYVDQSLMTGESRPSRKQMKPAGDNPDGPEQAGCLYRGTQVVDGAGRMLVTDVGDATYLGQIAQKLSADDGAGDEAISADTAERRIQRKLTISKKLTPLQLKLKNLADLISKVGYVAAVLIFLALLARGIWFSDPREVFWPQSSDQTLHVAQSLLNYFVYMVIVIVVAVPEGLPMSVTVSLALAMQKMTRANSLVRQLVACETIGSATVICSDKTGTLTQNKMQVGRLFWDGVTRIRGAADWAQPDAQAPWPRDGQPLNWLVLNAAVNSTANLEEKPGSGGNSSFPRSAWERSPDALRPEPTTRRDPAPDATQSVAALGSHAERGNQSFLPATSVLVPVGNSTEGSLLQWLAEAGLNYHKLRGQFPPVFLIHFSSERKRMTTVVRSGERLVVLVKGSPEWVLQQSTHYQTADGHTREWTTEARSAVTTALRDSAGQAMRTLAFAHAELPAHFPADADALQARRDDLETGLVFDGFAAISDPLRKDVKEAVAQCRKAGIEVKMITGDNVETASAIAFDVGLIDRRDGAVDEPGAVVLTSPKFNEWYKEMEERKIRGDAAGTEELAARLAGLRVLARARPLDKYKMVELLQDRQQVVAVTGDGTNDAPALKKADVGLAMGITGTEVAKEASKIVLLDDSFATIVKAVRWGRSLYENIQRFIQFQLTINVSALTIAFLGPFFGVRPPFTVLQLLWINVIMDTFASIALCSEPPREGVMRLPPKRKDESILTPSMLVTIFATAAFLVVVMLGLLCGMEYGNWFRDGYAKDLTLRQASIFFTVYVFFQVWNQINARALTPDVSGFDGLLGNRTFLAIAVTIAVVQALIISVPFLAAVFNVEPLGPWDWLCILAGTASVLVFGEVLRRVRLAWNGSLNRAGNA